MPYEIMERTSRGARRLTLELIEAAKHGKLDTVLAMLKDGSTCSVQDLLRAVVCDYHSIRKGPRHVALAEYLLSCGAQPHWQLVCEATRGGHAEIARLLMAYGAERNIYVSSALGQANHVARLLAMDSGAALLHDQDGMTALHHCCASALGKHNLPAGQSLTTVARQLLDAGTPINASAHRGSLVNVTPLVCACWTGGNVDIVRTLLERGATVSVTAFWAALGHYQRHGDGHYDIAEMLLKCNIDINRNDGRTILHAFAAHEDLIGVQWLLAHGADVSKRAVDGRTALHAAAARNSGTKVILALLAHRADDGAVDDAGQTPLDLAIARGKHEIIQCLRSASGLP